MNRNCSSSLSIFVVFLKNGCSLFRKLQPFLQKPSCFLFSHCQILRRNMGQRLSGSVLAAPCKNESLFPHPGQGTGLFVFAIPIIPAALLPNQGIPTNGGEPGALRGCLPAPAGLTFTALWKFCLAYAQRCPTAFTGTFSASFFLPGERFPRMWAAIAVFFVPEGVYMHFHPVGCKAAPSGPSCWQGAATPKASLTPAAPASFLIIFCVGNRPGLHRFLMTSNF